MSKHKLTAKLLKKITKPPYMVVSHDLEEYFFSIYNAERRKSELEYLGYEQIMLIDAKDINR